MRVAESEASATGELQAAKLESQQIKRRLKSLKKLHAKGHATQQELDAAHGQLTRANSDVERLQTRHAKLKQDYLMVQQLLQESGTGELVSETKSRIDLDLLGASELSEDSWPLRMLTDLQVLRYGLELGRNQLESVAQLEALLLKKTMLEAYWAKLKRNHADTSSALSMGTRRQLDDLKLEIRYCDARRQATQERLEILAAEQRRFGAQCEGLVEDQRSADLPDTKIPLHLRAKPVSLINSAKGARTRFSYLELDCFGHPELLRQCVAASNGADDLWLGLGDTNSYSPRNLGWLSFYSYKSLGGRTSSRARATNLGQRIDELDSERSSSSSNEGLRNRRASAQSFKFSNAYPFGILRSDLRRRQTPGQHPWYLPGSPANFKPRKIR